MINTSPLNFAQKLSNLRPRSAIAIGTGQAALFAVIGFLLAMAAWGEDRTPAIAVTLPLIWILAPTRWAAFALGVAYHLGVVRFVPSYATTWFDSQLMGAAIWLAIGLISGTAWALCWTKSRRTPWVLFATAGSLLITLLPPVAVVLPGHPLVGWGYLLPQTGWIGVAMMFTFSMAGTWLLRVRLVQDWPSKPWVGPVFVAAFVVTMAVVGMQPGGDVGKIVGKIGAVSTRLGGPPPQFSIEVMERIEKINTVTVKMAGGEDGLSTVVFPEGILGLYDPSLYTVLKVALLNKSRQAGQTVVIGTDLQTSKREFQTVAVVFKPDGTSTYIASRQAPPVSMWAPWSPYRHYPSNWFADNTIGISKGIRARIMFCYEEYLPFLTLIDEAMYDQNLVITMSNLWASNSRLPNTIQAAHTQGMALLFGKQWVRSVNMPKAGPPAR